MRTHPRHAPASQRYRRGILFAALCICIGVIWTSVRGGAGNSDTPVIIIGGDPVRVAAFSSDGSRLTVMQIPADTVIQAAMGYGTYPIGSLPVLDAMENKSGALLMSSAADAFGIPVHWYVLPASSVANDPYEALRGIFSWSTGWRRIVGAVRTNIPIAAWLRFTVAVRSIRRDLVEVIDAGQWRVGISMPDGTNVMALDENRLDYYTGLSFADARIRSEKTTVAVYNTTDIPDVAVRASRLITRRGAHVLFVGNARTDTESCLIYGSQDALRTRTAVFLRSYFACRTASDPPVSDTSGSDIVVMLGKGYASLYVRH